MAIRAEVDEAAGKVRLRHPRREPISVDPDDPADAARLVAWVTPLNDPGRAQPAFVVRARVGMTDSDFPSISVLNRASLAALGERLGKPLAMERFRGNVWLEGLAPFAEFGLVGREMRLGAAVVAVRQRITRCVATTVDPETGVERRRHARRAGGRVGAPGLRGLCRGGAGRARRGRRSGGGVVKARFTVAPEPDAEALERGRLLFAGPCDFLKGVVAMDGLPPADRLEVCFAGRSNVGKSSLINALTGRKALARASNTPGRTQEINFFALGAALYLVDLPGYGFAEAPKPVVEKWQALLRAYLAGRPTLRRVFLLVDARHGVKAVDGEIMALMDRSAVTFQLVLTKADKPGAAALAATIDGLGEALARHPAAFPEIIVTLGRDRGRARHAAGDDRRDGIATSRGGAGLPTLGRETSWSDRPMKRGLLATLFAVSLGTTPGFAQSAAPATTPAEQPVPVPEDAPQGSSGAGSQCGRQRRQRQPDAGGAGGADPGRRRPRDRQLKLTPVGMA